jgi:hypothetical protein
MLPPDAFILVDAPDIDNPVSHPLPIFNAVEVTAEPGSVILPILRPLNVPEVNVPEEVSTNRPFSVRVPAVWVRLPVVIFKPLALIVPVELVVALATVRAAPFQFKVPELLLVIAPGEPSRKPLNVPVDAPSVMAPADIERPVLLAPAIAASAGTEMVAAVAVVPVVPTVVSTVRMLVPAAFCTWKAVAELAEPRVVKSVTSLLVELVELVC